MKEIRDRYDEARAAWAEWRTRAIEDLKFSNPASPQQWAPEVIQARGRSRPALVFDQTNQYIGQVVNDARQNKPAIDVLPGDSDASDKAAEFYGGLVRQIEYASRAQIAYDTAIEYAARIGLGYLLVVPELQDGKLNDHELRIKSIVDPLAVTFDPDSREPDGQDADCAWLESVMSEAAFKRRWPKAKMSNYKGDRWFDGKGVLVCQYFERGYSKTNRIVLQDGSEYGEDDYHEARKTGELAAFHSNYESSQAKTKWQWLSGEEVLEETDYPAPYVGIVPVYGNVLWVDGKREVCGMTRRMMDGQRAYNYERSAYIEAVALSPKAPWLAPSRAIAKYQGLWDNSNVENRAVLPYDHVDAEGNAIPVPTRQMPPMPGSAFVENAQLALQDIQASVGMYKANLGQNSNAKSGVAINKLQTEGDTATFHYIDNLSRSIEQVGRLCVAMIPTYYDRDKVQRILGVDGKPSSARINPKLPVADAQTDMLEVNPSVGTYAVRVKTGPSYTSLRQEMQDRLAQVSQGNPALGAAMAPLLLQQSDMPGADKAAKVALALLPPEVRKAYDDEDGQQPQIPPEMMAEVNGMQQHIQQMGQALQEAAQKVKALEAELKSKDEANRIAGFKAETERSALVLPYLPAGAVAAIAQSVGLQVIASDDISPPTRHGQTPVEEFIPPDPAAMQQPQDPASAGFSVSGPEAMQPDQGYPPEMAATGAHPGLGSEPILPEGM